MEEELHVRIVCGLEVMVDVGSYHFIRSSVNLDITFEKNSWGYEFSKCTTPNVLLHGFNRGTICHHV